jgi:branched-chain amino acid transport system ATP-binding protein
MQIAQRVLVLDFGQPIALGSPAQIQRDARVIRAYLGQELDPANGNGNGNGHTAPAPSGGAAEAVR